MTVLLSTTMKVDAQGHRSYASMFLGDEGLPVFGAPYSSFHSWDRYALCWSVEPTFVVINGQRTYIARYSTRVFGSEN